MTPEVCLEIGAKRDYAGRYAPVARRAGIRFGAKAARDLQVVERVAGNATTDFGTPNMPARAEGTAVDTRSAKRTAALVSAAWELFDEAVAGAPASLRKGPRGGGRDRDKIAVHVADAAGAYARKLGITGLRHPDAVRQAILEALGRPSKGPPVARKGWTTRYAARRLAWHLLDHPWEIEDRTP